MATRIAVMRDGILQQIDTPQNLYDHPANVFVAGFIGSPAMNFFNAKVVRADGGLAVKTPSFTVPVPSSRQDQYASYVDKDVVFGIRPDDIHDPDFAPPGIEAAPVEMRVDVTELMGNEIFVFMVTGEDQFVGRFDPRTKFNHGGEGKTVLNMANMHLFDTSGLQETIN